jgi:hypothetical protein
MCTGGLYLYTLFYLAVQAQSKGLKLMTVHPLLLGIHKILLRSSQMRLIMKCIVE